MQEFIRIIVLNGGVIQDIHESIKPIGYKKNGELNAATQNFLKAAFDEIREQRGKNVVVIEMVVNEKKEAR